MTTDGPQLTNKEHIRSNLDINNTQKEGHSTNNQYYQLNTAYIQIFNYELVPVDVPVTVKRQPEQMNDGDRLSDERLVFIWQFTMFMFAVKRFCKCGWNRTKCLYKLPTQLCQKTITTVKIPGVSNKSQHRNILHPDLMQQRESSLMI